MNSTQFSSRRLGPPPLPLRGIPPTAGTGSGPRRRQGHPGRRSTPGLTGHWRETTLASQPSSAYILNRLMGGALSDCRSGAFSVCRCHSGSARWMPEFTEHLRTTSHRPSRRALASERSRHWRNASSHFSGFGVQWQWCASHVSYSYGQERRRLVGHRPQVQRLIS